MTLRGVGAARVAGAAQPRRRRSSPMSPVDRRLVGADQPARSRPRRHRYGYLLDDDEKPLPDPRSRRQPDGVHERSATFDPGDFAWTDQAWTGRQLAGATIYELHVGTFTPSGTLDAVAEKLDHLASPRRRVRRADAGQRLQRRAQLGLRRRAVVRRARAVRRTARLPAARRRLPPRGHRRHPGRRLQPSRPVGQLPPALRALPQGRPQHLGRPGQPRRRGLGRGPALHPRQRADVAARLPRRRPSARRRARAVRRVGHPPAGAVGRRGRVAARRTSTGR